MLGRLSLVCCLGALPNHFAADGKEHFRHRVYDGHLVGIDPMAAILPNNVSSLSARFGNARGLVSASHLVAIARSAGTGA